MMKKTYGIVAIAIDDCCALEVVNNKYRIISAKENANAYKVYWKNGQFYEEVIEKTEIYNDLDKLISK